MSPARPTAARAVLSLAESFKGLSASSAAAPAAFEALKVATTTVAPEDPKAPGGSTTGRVIFWPASGRYRQAPSPARFAQDHLHNGNDLVPPGTGRLRAVAIIAAEYERRYGKRRLRGPRPWHRGDRWEESGR